MPKEPNAKERVTHWKSFALWSMTIKFNPYVWIRFKWYTKWHRGRISPFTVACADETKDKNASCNIPQTQGTMGLLCNMLCNIFVHVMKPTGTTRFSSVKLECITHL